MAEPPRKAYPTDLTDSQWLQIAHLIPEPRSGPQEMLYHRRELYPCREVVNAILYVNRTGCQWRMLPHDLPPYRIDFHHFNEWKKSGVWRTVNDELRERDTERHSRAHSVPSQLQRGVTLGVQRNNVMCSSTSWVSSSL